MFAEMNSQCLLTYYVHVNNILGRIWRLDILLTKISIFYDFVIKY